MTGTDMRARTATAAPVFRLEGVRGLDLGKTFDCGQCFRFEQVAGSRHEIEVAGVAHGRPVSFAQDGDTLYIYNATQADFDAVWRRYLGLDCDYEAIDADILSRSSNPALAAAVEHGHGIRILRQQPWETVCSFIISQNNNIPRIKRIISALCERYGEPLDTRGMEEHGGNSPTFAFPTPEVLCAAGIDGIFALRTGFRAKYIYDAARLWSSGAIDVGALTAEAAAAGSRLTTAEAAAKLERIKGVGPKVAACSLLFGFGRYDAFPIDVWIRQVIAKYFGAGFTPSSLGPYAGVAQQYLFYYERYLGGEG